MQLRELLKSQQILNPLVSAKSTNQSVEWDAFSQLLAQKNTKTTMRDVQQPQQPQSQIDLQQKTELNGSSERKFTVKVSTHEPQPVKVSKDSKVNEVVDKPVDRATDKPDDKPVEKLKPKDDESRVEKNDNDDDSSGIKEKLKNALKAKLKKEVGLDDQQLDALLANLNLDMDALAKLLENGELAGAIFTELTAVLETLEIDVALNQEMSPKDVDQVVKQIDKLIDALSKLQNTKSNESANTITSEDEEGKAFEMKLIQSLSRVIASLSSNESETVVRPEDVRNAIVESLSQPIVATTASDKPQQVNSEEQVDNLIAKVVTTANTPQNNSSTAGEKQSSQNLASEATVNTTNPTTTTTNNQANAQTQMVSSNDSASGNSDLDVKVVEDNKGINVHQMTMKQNNAITSPTIMPSGQVKQEIFTQIMDAIKGQIKLSDHGTSLIVKLQPEQLGNVELKLNIQKGIVLAEIKVENEIVKAAIESNLDDLKQSLSNKGYSVDQINVSVDSGKKDQQQAFEFNGQERKNRQTQKPDENANNETVETVNRYVVDEYEGSTINYYG